MAEIDAGALEAAREYLARTLRDGTGNGNAIYFARALLAVQPPTASLEGEPLDDTKHLAKSVLAWGSPLGMGTAYWFEVAQRLSRAALSRSAGTDTPLD